MSYKKWSIINVFLILLIATILHYAYELIPNNIVASFTPVNESIFEHMKMNFNSFIIASIIEYFYLKRFNYNNNNYMFKLLTSSLTCNFITLILYYPFYYAFGDNFIYTMTIFIISIIVSQVVSYLISTTIVEDKVINLLSFIIILMLEFIFIYSTFNPKETEIFIDHTNKKIGVYNYIETPKEDI